MQYNQDIYKNIFNAKTKQDVINVLNGITVDGNLDAFTWTGDIGTNWSPGNTLYNMIPETMVSTMFYTKQDITDSSISADRWVPNTSTGKQDASLSLIPVKYNTEYRYVMLPVNQEDMDDVNKSGEYEPFVKWVNAYQQRSIEDNIISVMLDGTGYIGTAIYKLVRDTSTDFETVEVYTQTSASDTSYITVANLQSLASNVVKHDMRVMCINPDDLRTLYNASFTANEVYNFTSDSDIAAVIGVDYIFSTSLIKAGHVIILDPTCFHIRKKAGIDISFPVYEENKVTFLKEMNVSVKPAAYHSAAILKGSLN